MPLTNRCYKHNSGALLTLLPCTRCYKPFSQEKALAATKAAIHDKIGEADHPEIIYIHGCHSTMQVQGQRPLHARLQSFTW